MSRYVTIGNLQTSRVVLTGEKAVVLVGGFGASEYLCKRLKEVCNAQGIDLFNPDNA